MKKISFAIFISTILLLESCNELPRETSPIIQIADVLVNGEYANSDTIHVADTIIVRALLNPTYNTLTEFDVTYDRNYIQDSIFTDEDYATFCDTNLSNRKSGKYVFKGLNAGESLGMSMIFITKQKSEDVVKIDFALSSDAKVKAEYNPAQLGLRFYVIE